MTEDQWVRALWGEDHNLLQYLINTEYPFKVLQNLTIYIHNLYQRHLVLPEIYNKERIALRINQLKPVIIYKRSVMDWMEQRICDLAILRFIRVNGGLSIALGAGTSMYAGGPSWSNLVRKLLSIALEKGHEIETYDRLDGEKSFEIKRRVIKVEYFTKEQIEMVKKIIDKIDNNSADCEILKEGAQLCADLFKESLFQQITMIVYANTFGSGGIHNNIAKLAQKQKLIVHNAITSGWSGIINYNFDSLIIDALEKFDIPYVFYCMRNGKYEQYTVRGKSSDIKQEVVYLHGFTPRQPFFDIAGMDFVFSTSQYADIYGENETIIDYVNNKYIKNPNNVMLYVGCSFTDTNMNNLLKETIEQYPFKFHYALLKLPENFIEKSFQISNEELGKLNEKYQHFGIQPIWFMEYSEIPDILLKLT